MMLFLILCLILAYNLANIIYNLFFSPLSRFPGPKLWAISRIPSQWAIVRGTYHIDINKLYDTYGQIIRIGPNELAFNTPEAFQDIYTSRAGRGCFPKDSTRYFPPMNGVDSMISTTDDFVHTRHRKLMSHAFSERMLRNQEGLVTKYVDLLVVKLREKTSTNDGQANHGQCLAKVDIKNWFNFTTFDINGEFSFGSSFGCLSTGELHPWIALMFVTLKDIALAGAVKQFPYLSSILTKMLPQKVAKMALDHFNLCVQRVDERLAMDVEKPDLVSVIQRNGFCDSKSAYEGFELVMTRAELHSNAFVFVIAGSETTATCLSGCIFYLCKYPEVMNRLVRDIRDAFINDSAMTFSQTATLPFLQAVIEETLRIYPPFVAFLGRVTPKEGAIVSGHSLPGGTKVAIHHWASYHSSSNFTKPHEFIPDRWLDNKLFPSDRLDVLHPFSLGPRGCPGKVLAYAEIRMVLCKLLFNFDVELCLESVNWADQKAYFLWDKPALMVKLKPAHNS